MSLRINTNMASLAIQHQISRTQRDFEGVLKSLASGNRFDDSRASSADRSIAEQLRAQISGAKAAQRNADTAQSFIQVAEGGLNEQNNILIRMRELAIQAASDTFSDVEREMLNTEFVQLQQEVDRISKVTQFGSTPLLSGQEREFEFQVGANNSANDIVKFKSNTDTGTSALGVEGLTVDERSDARDALEDIDGALTKIATARSNFGAVQSRLDSTIDNAGVQIENLSEAHSRMADTDIAEAASKMYRNQALQQYQIAILAQANQAPGTLLRLVG